MNDSNNSNEPSLAEVLVNFKKIGISGLPVAFFDDYIKAWVEESGIPCKTKEGKEVLVKIVNIEKRGDLFVIDGKIDNAYICIILISKLEDRKSSFHLIDNFDVYETNSATIFSAFNLAWKKAEQTETENDEVTHRA